MRNPSECAAGATVFESLASSQACDSKQAWLQTPESVTLSCTGHGTRALQAAGGTVHRWFAPQRLKEYGSHHTWVFNCQNVGWLQGLAACVLLCSIVAAAGADDSSSATSQASASPAVPVNLLNASRLSNATSSSAPAGKSVAAVVQQHAPIFVRCWRRHYHPQACTKPAMFCSDARPSQLSRRQGRNTSAHSGI